MDLLDDETCRQLLIDSVQRGPDAVEAALNALARARGVATEGGLSFADAIEVVATLGLRFSFIPLGEPPVDGMPPTHPGELLREEYLAPLGMRARDLAVRLHVAQDRVQAVIDERAPIDADMALRLSRYFGSTAEFWLSLQATYDLKTLPTRTDIELVVKRRIGPGW